MPTALINAIKSYPEGVTRLSLHELTTFNALIYYLKEQISWHQSATLPGPPLSLPNDVVAFCADALHSSHAIIIQSWKAFSLCGRTRTQMIQPVVYKTESCWDFFAAPVQTCNR